MMRQILFFVFCVVSITGYAQEMSKDDIEREKAFRERAAKLQQDSALNYGWTHKVITGINL